MNFPAGDTFVWLCWTFLGRVLLCRREGIVEEAKTEFVEKSLLRLKAAAFLGLAARTGNPTLAKEALRIAERCFARAVVLDAPPPEAAPVTNLRKNPQRP